MYENIVLSSFIALNSASGLQDLVLYYIVYSTLNFSLSFFKKIEYSMSVIIKNVYIRRKRGLSGRKFT